MTLVAADVALSVAVVAAALVVALRPRGPEGRPRRTPASQPTWFDGSDGRPRARTASLAYLGWALVPVLPIVLADGPTDVAPLGPGDAPWWGLALALMVVLGVVGRRMADRTLRPLNPRDPWPVQRIVAGRRLVTWVHTHGPVGAAPLVAFTAWGFVAEETRFWAACGGVLTAVMLVALTWPERVPLAHVAAGLERNGARIDLAEVLAEVDDA